MLINEDSSSSSSSSSRNEKNNSKDAIFHYDFNTCTAPMDTEKAVVKEGVKIIKHHSFFNCSMLASVSIPDSVTTIQGHAFSSCRSLILIDMPARVTTVAYSTFSDCSSLASFVVPDGVTTIESGAFRNCSSLTSIVIPDSVTLIEDEAFSDCSSLISIAIPDNDVTIHQDAFSGCNLLDQRQQDDDNYNPENFKWLQQRFAKMPIHQACYNAPLEDISTDLLSNLIRTNKNTLALTDAMGMTALHLLCCNPNVTLEAIKLLKNAHPDSIFARNVAGMTPLMILLKCRGLAYDKFHEDGQLVSLVGLLELGVEYDILEIIMDVFHEEMALMTDFERSDDEVTNLLPFMHAALLSQCTLDVIYILASRQPHLLCRFNCY